MGEAAAPRTTFIPVDDSHSCTSADSRCLVVPRTRIMLDTRNFAVAGPGLWSRSRRLGLEMYQRRQGRVIVVVWSSLK